MQIVGWGFKQARFDQHARALGVAVPVRHVAVGVPGDVVAAEAGEAHTRALFDADPFGTTGALRDKRNARNPFRRTPPYDLARWPQLGIDTPHASQMID